MLVKQIEEMTFLIIAKSVHLFGPNVANARSQEVFLIGGILAIAKKYAPALPPKSETCLCAKG